MGWVDTLTLARVHVRDDDVTECVWLQRRLMHNDGTQGSQHLPHVT